VETEELIDLNKEVHGVGERMIGLTMAITAAFLATVTLMGHRLHTEEVVLQTKSADGWAYYQAKNNRYHMYANDAKLAELTGSKDAAPVVADWLKKSAEEHTQAEEVRHENERLDKETETAARRATFFDLGEICIEVGIVLCSISLLTRAALFWRASFVPTLLGIGVALFGFLR
jgi:hypothetical protein